MQPNAIRKPGYMHDMYPELKCILCNLTSPISARRLCHDGAHSAPPRKAGRKLTLRGPLFHSFPLYSSLLLLRRRHNQTHHPYNRPQTTQTHPTTTPPTSSSVSAASQAVWHDAYPPGPPFRPTQVKNLLPPCLVRLTCHLQLHWHQQRRRRKQKRKRAPISPPLSRF